MAIINGTNGNNNLLGTTDADQINGLGGDDVINALTRPPAGGFDVVDGGTGIDTLVVDASGETQSVQLGYGSTPTFGVFSDSGNFRVDAYNMEKINFTGGSGGDIINSGERGGSLNGNGGIDHWLANLGAVFANVTFNLGTTTSIAAAGLTSVLGMEQISLTTGSGNDTITGGSLADTISTGIGNDVINAKSRSPSAGFDVVDGGEDLDTLIVNASSETQGVQLNFGGAPTFGVFSDSGKFRIDAYNMERVEFTGGSGGDFINTGTAGGRVNGRTGIDHWLANLAALTSDVTFTLGTTTAIAAAGLTSILEIERITLTTGSGNDTITGGAQADTINTGSGNDIVNARTRPMAGGFDVVDGGLGIDTLVVNAASETQAIQLFSGGAPSFGIFSDSGNFRVDAYNFEHVMVTGGGGNDSLNTGAGGATVDGRGGIDHWLANLSSVTANITFTLGTTSSIAGAGLTSIERIERITLITGSGKDNITGGAQADSITANEGNDTINPLTRPSAPGSGFDVADGGAGIDTLVVDASSETMDVDLFSGGAPSFGLFSDSGNFRADAYNMEKVVFTGGAGNDSAAGLGLADTLKMGAGNDTAGGGGGADTIIGGNGNDTLRGGRGGDSLSGGDGSDRFNYAIVAESGLTPAEADTITDFQSGSDKIDVSAIDANFLFADGNQAFTFIGGSAFGNNRGELRSVAGRIEADVNGDGIADFRILLSNGAVAVAGDFIL